MPDLHLYLEWVRCHFFWFSYWLIPAFVFWHVSGPLFGCGKMAVLCAAFLNQSDIVWGGFVINLKSLSCVVSGINTSRCEPLLISCIRRALFQSLSWSRKTVVWTGVCFLDDALRSKSNLYKPQILGKIVIMCPSTCLIKQVGKGAYGYSFWRAFLQGLQLKLGFLKILSVVNIKVI